MHQVFIALGSNIESREEHISSALKLLETLGTVVACARIIETDPKYKRRQPRFLNTVCELHTPLTPEKLLESLQTIEHKLGRVRVEKNGPRTIDLDILSYDSLVTDTPSLTIPHPLLHERLFVLKPWSEIAPDFTIARYNKTVGQLLKEIS